MSLISKAEFDRRWRLELKTEIDKCVMAPPPLPAKITRESLNEYLPRLQAHRSRWGGWLIWLMTWLTAPVWSMYCVLWLWIPKAEKSEEGTIGFRIQSFSSLIQMWVLCILIALALQLYFHLGEYNLNSLYSYFTWLPLEGLLLLAVYWQIYLGRGLKLDIWYFLFMVNVPIFAGYLKSMTDFPSILMFGLLSIFISMVIGRRAFWRDDMLAEKWRNLP
jgi:hypothetical protein